MNTLPEYKNADKFFAFFEEISKIPRGSGNTKPIADHLTEFAKARSLEYFRDCADNVIIRKPATPGYEKRPALILQGHTDMVLASVSGNTDELQKNGVKIIRDGDILKADNTTLGADDGVAVAYAMAILDSDDIPHPDFEAVFTSDEEIGLLGATALDGSLIKGKMMINIDSDAEGIFTVGCAGGKRVDISLPLKRSATNGQKYTLTLDGLSGGHSGIDINKNRTNAIKRIAEYLTSFGDIRLISLSGGVADNAIAPSAVAEFTSNAEISAISKIIDDVKASAPADSEKEKLTLIKAGELADAITLSDTKKLLSLVSELPSGVIAMSRDIEGQVETSLNLGIIETNEKSANIAFSLRSSVGKEKEKLTLAVREIAERFGADVSEHGDYPAWEYRKESPLRDTMCRVFKNMYAKDAEVVTIHAGLECGIFSDKIDGLDCVSIGPDSFNIHTPKERLSISSAVRVWEFLLEVLKSI